MYTPPYTPAAENDPLFVSPSQWYFDSRPVSYRAVGPTFSHEVGVARHSRFEDLSTQYDASFADRDITTQDWATFINFLLPHHIDTNNENVAREKMKAEILDERMRRLTIDGEKQGLNMAAVDAQLGQLAPHMGPSEEHIDAESVVREWNSGFFEPRGVRIVACMEREDDDPPIVLPDEMSEFRHNSFASTRSGEAATTSLPTRPDFCSERARSGDVNDGGRHGRHRNWGWSDHGPGQHRNRNSIGRGRNCTGGYRMGILDNNEGCGGCRHCGPRRATIDGDAPQRARTEGEFYVPQGEHFKLGPIVADESGFRIGNLMRATSEGVNIGPMFVGKKPPAYGSDYESEGSTASDESEGTLPDLDDVTPRQLPVLRQSLMDWLNHPEQPVTKVQMDQLKTNLKLTQKDKTNVKPEGEELKALKIELKEMKRKFKEAKRERRQRSKQAKRERRLKKREERRNRRQARLEEKLALKREAKGKGKATHCSIQAAREAREAAQTESQHARDAAQTESQQARDAAQMQRDGAQTQAQQIRDAAQSQAQQARDASQALSQNLQQSIRQQVNGFRGFVTPPTAGRTPNTTRGPFRPFGIPVPQPPAPPAPPASAPPVPAMPSMSRHLSNNSSHSNISPNSELHDNVSYLRSEAARQISEAGTLRASAESMRKETQNTAFDEKTRVKLSYDAADLEEEATRLVEEADRQLAEALQLEGDEGDNQRREAESNRVDGRSYLRRMRENSGVIGVIV